MFKRSLVPVWIGIIVLSCMFLMGQDTWGPVVCDDLYSDSWPGTDLGEYPSITSGNVSEPISPSNDSDWMSLYAEEQDSSTCSYIRCTAKFTHIPEGQSYQLCVCWSKNDLCDLVGWVCTTILDEEVATSFREDTLSAPCIPPFGNGVADWGYCEIRVEPIGAADHSCENYNISFSVDEW